MYRLVIIAAAIAAANAGFLEAPVAAVAYSAPHAIASPAVVSQHSNIIRTPGNLGQVSTYSKSIQTPHSSVTKSDIRVSNDALAYHAAPVAAVAAAPVAAVAAHPVTYAAHSAPVATIAAHPVATTYAAHATPVAVGHSVGLSYSAAPVVSHITFEGIGAHYAY